MGGWIIFIGVVVAFGLGFWWSDRRWRADVDRDERSWRNPERRARWLSAHTRSATVVQGLLFGVLLWFVNGRPGIGSLVGGCVIGVAVFAAGAWIRSRWHRRQRAAGRV